MAAHGTTGTVEQKEVLNIAREKVITIMKPRLVAGLSELIVDELDRQDFLLLCSRMEATIRAWYHREMEELMQLYVLFDPVSGRKKLEQQNLSPSQIENLEDRCLMLICKVLEKSNYALLNDDEYAVATSGHYLLDFQIAVDTSKLDMKMLGRYFRNHSQPGLPKYAHEYLVFRRGVGMDRTSGLFVNEKMDMLLVRMFNGVLEFLRLKEKSPGLQLETASVSKKTDQSTPDSTRVTYERLRLENMPLTTKTLFGKVTIQEPTFERVVVLYRPATHREFPSELGDRSIVVKHFHDIPMADMEIVLPEKKEPGLAPMDWLRFLVAAIGGAYALIATQKKDMSLAVLLGILSAVAAYASKIYATWQASMTKYRTLVMNTMYAKQLDSGKGTLLNLSDEMIQQETKEVIVAYFVLMTQGKATKEELDRRCEDLLMEEFKVETDFDVEDAVGKLRKLGIIDKDVSGAYTHQSLKKALEEIGTTTEEMVAMHDQK